MTLSFCHDIQMVGSDFDINNMKAWIHPASGLDLWWWCNGMGDFFMAHFGSLIANWASFKHHSHRVLLLAMSIPLWPQSIHLVMPTSSRNHYDHVTMSSPYSNDLHSCQISIQGQLCDVVDREICIIDVQPTNPPATVWCYHVSMDQNLRNISSSFLNLCHKGLRQFWRQKGVQPGTSKVYLIKWPVSLYGANKLEQNLNLLLYAFWF